MAVGKERVTHGYKSKREVSNSYPSQDTNVIVLLDTDTTVL